MNRRSKESELNFCILFLLSIVCLFLVVAGCSITQEPALIEKQYKTQFSLMRYGEEEEIIEKERIFTPPSSTSSKKGIEITIRPITRRYMDAFFQRKDIFGPKAKINPYPPNILVFYIKLVNNSGEKIWINPHEFTLLDDTKSQYSFLSPESIMGIIGKGTVASVSEAGSKVAPGVYGAPFTVAYYVSSGPFKKKLSLLKQVTFNGGYVYDGVTYEGFISFLRPSDEAHSSMLLLPNIKTEFNVNDEPADSLDLEFEFKIE